MPSLIRSIVLLLAACAVVSPCIAQDDPCVTAVNAITSQNAAIGSDSIFAILNGERGQGCILGPSDQSDIEQRYQVLFDVSSSDALKVVARTELFDLAAAEIASWPTQRCDIPNDFSCVADRQLAAIIELRTLLIEGDPAAGDKLVDLNSWQVRNDTGTIAISDVVLRDLLENACVDDLLGADCASGIQFSSSMMRSSIAMGQVIAAYQMPTIEANAEFLSRRDQEWAAYFNDVSVQWPWELGLNSRLYARANDGESGGVSACTQ